MKPTRFIKCSTSDVTHGLNKYINNPINISLVSRVSKNMLKIYPDNTGIPSIEFYTFENKISWAYEDIKIRDLDFERLSVNSFEDFDALLDEIWSMRHTHEGHMFKSSVLSKIRAFSKIQPD